MRISRKTQNTIKNVVSAVLAIAILLGVASLIGGLTRADDDERVKVHPTFSVGGLNEVGKYVESEGTIYTKEAFECQGLKVELDFEKTIYYEVFFYTEMGEFLSSTAKTNENSMPELPVGATHARIVITPDWELLEIKKEKEKVIKWYEIAKYANQITLKVNEEQFEYVYEFNEVSLADSSLFTKEEGCYYSATGEKISSSNYTSYVFVATEHCQFYMDSDLTNVQYVIQNGDNFARYQKTNGTWVSGEENAFELNVGDKVYVSATDTGVSNIHFYLGTLVFAEE